MTEIPHILHCGITADQLAKEINFEGEIPEIIVATGPTRSGTTLLARIMGEQGIKSWYQPVKALLRNLMYGYKTGMSVPGKLPQIFMKETLGVFHTEEALFNPVEVLQKKGVPPNKIKFMPVLRDPLTTAASILEKYKFQLGKLEELHTDNDLIEIFLASYKNLAEIQKYADEQGIVSAPCIYEAYRDNDDPVEVLLSLGKKLGINFDRARLEGWKPVEDITEFTIHLDEPEFFYTGSDFWSDVKRSTGLHYSDSTSKKISQILLPEQIKKIMDSEVYKIYHDFVKRGINTLGVKLDIQVYED